MPAPRRSPRRRPARRSRPARRLEDAGQADLDPAGDAAVRPRPRAGRPSAASGDGAAISPATSAAASPGDIAELAKASVERRASSRVLRRAARSGRSRGSRNRWLPPPAPDGLRREAARTTAQAPAVVPRRLVRSRGHGVPIEGPPHQRRRPRSVAHAPGRCEGGQDRVADLDGELLRVRATARGSRSRPRGTRESRPRPGVLAYQASQPCQSGCFLEASRDRAAGASAADLGRPRVGNRRHRERRRELASAIGDLSLRHGQAGSPP